MFRSIVILAAASALAAAPAFAPSPALAQSTAELNAQTGETADTGIIRASDDALTCGQIADEAAELSASMGTPPTGGLFQRLGGVARAGVALVVPGGQIATAAADALTQPGRDAREAREVAAQQRWYYLNGLYAGHRCQAQAEAAEAEVPAPTLPAPTLPAPIPPSVSPTVPHPATQPVAVPNTPPIRPAPLAAAPTTPGA